MSKKPPAVWFSILTEKYFFAIALHTFPVLFVISSNATYSILFHSSELKINIKIIHKISFPILDKLTRQMLYP